MEWPTLQSIINPCRGCVSVNSWPKHADNSALVIVLWLALWALRFYEDSTKSSDLFLFFMLRLWMLYEESEALCSHSSVIRLSLLYSGAICGAILLLLSVVAFHQNRQKVIATKWQDVSAEQPLFHYCRTTHTRLFPQKHSFSYAYLQLSIPVTAQRCNGRILSVGGDRYSVFRVNPEQYLQRHCPASSLEGRLSAYLKSQGVSRDQWFRAYLVTAPQFLGYSFNPVSFWYIYDKRDHLSMMILEVNNTFDERRMYFLKPEDSDEQRASCSRYFSQRWPKDFHVSPFNSRKGFYGLRATNPFSRSRFQAPGIDNTIKLISSHGDTKLVARLHSEDAPVAWETISISQFSTVVLRWAWLGFFTSPRILKEAFVLFFRRKLHVWLRPEVMTTSIGRRATDTESIIEEHFRDYLKFFTTNCSVGLHLTYLNGSEPAMSFKPAVDNDSRLQYVKISVISPEFFTRLVHYTSVADALWHEGPGAADNCQTVSIEHLDVVQRELQANHPPVAVVSSDLGLVQYVQWKALIALRPSLSSKDYEALKGKCTNSGLAQMSSLEQYIIAHSTRAWHYRRAVTRLFLAERLSLGLVPAIDLCDIVLRATLMYVSRNDASRQWVVHIWAMLKG